MYEGHIPQATLAYNSAKKSFRRKTLQDSTSMVMSPIDLLTPDLQVFFNHQSIKFYAALQLYSIQTVATTLKLLIVSPV
jgi:hypothetical protein